MPFFSITTPSFNQGRFIEGAIRSVLAQNDTDFEHLVFDNCSTDETAATVARFSHVRMVREKDRGQAHAVNKGFAAAEGEVLCWLNADDEYEAGAFARVREAFSDPSVDVVFGDARQISYQGTDPVIARARFDNRLDLIRWWSPDVKLHQPAVFFRKKVFETIGPLREDLHYALDYEYWWRVSERFAFHYLPHTLAAQHRQPDSKTILDWDKVLEERERVFAPYYGWLRYDPTGLRRERNRCLAELHTSRAFAAVSNSPWTAWKIFWKAVLLRPILLATTTPVSLLRRTIWSAAA